MVRVTIEERKRRNYTGNSNRAAPHNSILIDEEESDEQEMDPSGKHAGR